MTTYAIKKGVQMHPFSDQSGVSFFDSHSTIITSVKIPEAKLNSWLVEDVLDINLENGASEDQIRAQVINELLDNGFIRAIEKE